MAISVTSLYLRHHEDHDLTFTKEEEVGNPLDAHTVHYMRAVEDSKKINDVKTPAIIISASGMATGGRVLHHIAQRAPDPRNAILLAGFQAEGTRGRALEEGAKTIAHPWRGCAGGGGSRSIYGNFPRTPEKAS